MIFCDEACIWFGKTGRMYVRRPRGKHIAYKDEYVAKYEHHGEKINIIGFITVHGVGGIEIFDNDKKFNSGMVAEWCHNNGVTVLDFPPYSPDLNPIENVWAYLKYTITSLNPKNVDELRKLVVSEWGKIPLKKLQNCIKSMPKRCQAVIANNGYKTKY